MAKKINCLMLYSQKNKCLVLSKYPHSDPSYKLISCSHSDQKTIFCYYTGKKQNEGRANFLLSTIITISRWKKNNKKETYVQQS